MIRVPEKEWIAGVLYSLRRRGVFGGWYVECVADKPKKVLIVKKKKDEKREN